MAMQIQWYPGHMAKAQREIESKVKLVDIVIELVDARAPFSTHNPELDHMIKNKPRLYILTKKDLADPKATEALIAEFKRQGHSAIAVDLKNFKEEKKIVNMCRYQLKEKREKEAARGLKPKPIRALVAGIPNVGKSTFINKIAKRKAAAVGNKPGVTKAQQIIRVDKDFELFDTPGVLEPKFTDINKAMNVALCGSIKMEILPLDDLFIHAIGYLAKHYPDMLKQRYNLTIDLDSDWVIPVYDHISDYRHIKKLRGETDYDRVQETFFNDLKNENEARAAGYSRILGVDEAGRGPMAGPLVVGGVIFPEDFYDERINDSKKLTEKKREALYDLIIENALAYQIEVLSVEEVDTLNVYEASRTGMKRIVESLEPDFTLSDAMPLGDIPHLSIIKGDAKSISIGAASILAKVTRDRIMKEYGKQYPEYGFEKHKGYVTKAHKEALEKYGVTPIHRRSFAPVQKVLNEQLSFDFEEKD